MTQNRAEKAADALVRNDAASALATARVGKPAETGTAQPEEPMVGGRPPWLMIGGGLLVGLALLIGGWVGLSLIGGLGTNPSPTPTSPAIGTPTATPSSTTAVTPTAGSVITPSPTASPVSPMEVISIDSMLESIGVDEATRTQLSALIATDEISDWNEPDVALDPAEVDVISTLTFEAAIGAEFLEQFGACGDGLVCGSNAAGEPGTAIGVPGDYFVNVIQVRESLDGAPGNDLAYFEVGIVNFDLTPEGGGVAEPFDFGPISFMTGSNTAYSLRFNPGDKGFDNLLLRLVHGEADQFFHGENSTAFAVIRGPVAAVFIPRDEWDGAADFRLFSYYQTTAPASVSDTSPDMTEPMTLYDPTAFPLIGLPPSAVVVPPTALPALSMNNAFGDQEFARCSVTGTVTWTPSEAGATLTGTGTIQIQGPTLAGTHAVAAAGNQIRLPLTFQWTSQPRTWTVTLTNVEGQAVRPAPAGANGSQFSYSAAAFPNC